MGTFEQIRKISPYAFAAFAVLLVAFFVFGDPTVIEGLRGRSANPQDREIAIVNGEKILYVEYEKQVQEAIENQKRQQKDPNADVDQDMIRQQVFESLIEQTLVKQYSKKLGITVSNDEVLDALIDNPPDYLKQSFRDSSGKFNRDFYLRLVTRPEDLPNYVYPDPSKVSAEEKQQKIDEFRAQLIEIENAVRENKVASHLVDAISSSYAVISPSFAKMRYIQENSTAQVRYLPVLTRDLQQEAMKVSKEEIEKYYNENKEYFKQKAARQIKFVSFRLTPSAEDSAKFEKHMGDFAEAIQTAVSDSAKDSIFSDAMVQYNGTTNDYQMVNQIDPNILSVLTPLQKMQVAGPVRMRDGIYFYRVDDRRNDTNLVVRASHILISFGTNKDSAKAETMKILKEAKEGKDFAMLAIQYSQDKGSGRQGGDLGYFGKGRMVKPFEEAAFAAKVGDIVGPVESQFGYHIIKVTDRQSEQIKYSEIKFDPTMSSMTRNKIFMDAKSFSTQLIDGKNIDTLGKALNVPVRNSGFFENHQAVMGSHYIANWAYNAKIGDVLEPVEIKRLGIVVGKLTDIREPGFKPLDDVRTEISQKLMKIKLLDKAKEQAQQMYNMVKSYGSLENAASKDSSLAQKIRLLPQINYSPSIAGLGQDAAFAAAAFKLPENQINEPVRGEMGYYIIEVTNRKTPSDDDVKKNLSQFIVKLENTAKNSTFQQWFVWAKENADIVDRRSDFYSRDY